MIFHLKTVSIQIISLFALLLTLILPANINAQHAILTNFNLSSFESEGTNMIGYGPELEVAWQTQYIRLDDNLGINLRAGLFLQPRVFSENRSFAPDSPISSTSPRYNNSRTGVSLAIGLNFIRSIFDFEIGSGFSQHYSFFREIDRHGVTPDNPDEFSDWNTTFDLHFITNFNVNRNFGIRGGIKSQHLLTGDDFASLRLSPTVGMIFRY